MCHRSSAAILDVVRHHGPDDSNSARADQLPQGPVRRPPPPLIGDRKQRPRAASRGDQVEDFPALPRQRLLAQHGDFAFQKRRRLLEMELGRRANNGRIDPRQRDEILKPRTKDRLRSQGLLLVPPHSPRRYQTVPQPGCGRRPGSAHHATAPSAQNRQSQLREVGAAKPPFRSSDSPGKGALYEGAEG